MTEFITCGDTRIKISNIKQYGISLDHVEKNYVDKSQAEIDQMEKEYERKRDEYYRIKKQKTKEPGNIIKGIGGAIGGAVGGGAVGAVGGGAIGALGGGAGAVVGAVVGLPAGVIAGGVHFAQKAMGIPDKPSKPSGSDYQKEIEKKIHYLYITTYQNDNFKFVEGQCGFDIFVKRKQLDNILA